MADESSNSESPIAISGLAGGIAFGILFAYITEWWFVGLGIGAGAGALLGLGIQRTRDEKKKESAGGEAPAAGESEDKA
jgi:hypothetical protein